MKLFPIIDQVMLAQESRTAYFSWTPRVWPSEASALLFDQLESKIVGKCHRQSFFRLTGEPVSDSIDAVSARRFRTGRQMELDVVTLAKEAGIFVASGIRYHVADVDLPLELDLVVVDPATGRLYIVENKTIYGYNATKKVIKDGSPKIEGVMQLLIYLNEFTNGDFLKYVITEGWIRKQQLLKEIAELKQTGATEDEYTHLSRENDRNRIEVNFENLKKGLNTPVGAKLAYETRDDCQTREFDIGMFEDDDGLHYPTIDGIPTKLFTLESIYERYMILQAFYEKAKQTVLEDLASKGFLEPDETARPADIYKFREKVADLVRALPASFWPPAEFEWRYSDEKIEALFKAKLIGKTIYERWKKRAKGYISPGAWQCRFCSFNAKCVSYEYPQYAHVVNDLMADEEDAA